MIRHQLMKLWRQLLTYIEEEKITNHMVITITSNAENYNKIYLEESYEGASSIFVVIDYQTKSEYYEWINLYGTNGYKKTLGGSTLKHEIYEIDGNYIKIDFTTDNWTSDHYGFKAIVIPNYFGHSSYPKSDIVESIHYPYLTDNDISFSTTYEGATSITVELLYQLKYYDDYVGGDKINVYGDNGFYKSFNESTSNSIFNKTVFEIEGNNITLNFERNRYHWSEELYGFKAIITPNYPEPEPVDPDTPSPPVGESEVVESEHNPYPNSLDDQVFFEKTYDGATSITVEMEYQTESVSYDWIYLYGENGYQSDKLGDSTLITNTFEIPGNYLKIVFHTDGIVNDFFGFKATITPKYP